MVTAAEAQRLVEEPKVIEESLNWESDPQGFRLAARVVCSESEEPLELRGFVGRRNRSFALLFRSVPIRKYTVHAFHRDPVTREVVREPHKHFWDDEWGDRRVYIPDDIRIGDANEELMDFLQECNITLIGSYEARQFS